VETWIRRSPARRRQRFHEPAEAPDGAHDEDNEAELLTANVASSKSMLR
jgi:hypothetical protein